MARENVTADDYRDWALTLRSLWDRTDESYQGHICPEDEAALVLVEVLEPEQSSKLGYALLEHAPGLMQRVSDEMLLALKEEVLRDDTAFAYAVHNTIIQIENKWRQEG